MKTLPISAGKEEIRSSCTFHDDTEIEECDEKEKCEMEQIDVFCINLNIHYSAPQYIWDKIEKIYAEMPHWKGFVDGCPQWYGENGKLIEGSVEPSGLQLYVKLPQEEWDEWLQLFKDRATDVLGYPIGEPEEGYDFKYWQ